MKVYSGKCEHGICGTPTNLVDATGNSLCVGDIVMMATRDDQGIMYLAGLSVVFEDRPHLVGRTEQGNPFIMGLANVDINTDEEWYIKRVKEWSDCIPGEHWKDYGFNYQID